MRKRPCEEAEVWAPIQRRWLGTWALPSGSLSLPILDRDEIGALTAPLACGYESKWSVSVKPLGKW